uniref:HTH cro/C1-type domain-containing protein n=1 Tax=Magnetococcus massalia (strain MO-1) TaxID=451514 RepID=A0A1S7LIE5_MAGMO|nr:protein of unknown function [include Helix-turn-helix domain] [Candidatus Magnetococcus massalia]
MKVKIPHLQDPNRPHLDMGKRFAKARGDKGLTQLEVANQLGWARQKYAQYEVGVRSPRRRELAELCNLLEVTPGWILYGESGSSSSSPSAQRSCSSFPILGEPEAAERAIIDALYLQESWLEVHGLRSDNCSAMVVNDLGGGCAIPEGAVILARCNGKVVDGKPHVIAMDEQYLVRTLRLLPGKKAAVYKADNPEPDFTCSLNESSENITVIGRVAFVAHMGAV